MLRSIKQKIRNPSKPVGKEKLLSLLMGFLNYCVTIEISMELKKNRTLCAIYAIPRYISNWLHMLSSTSLFIAVIVIVARKYHTRCPSTQGWTIKLWYICTVGFYSSIKNHSSCGWLYNIKLVNILEWSWAEFIKYHLTKMLWTVDGFGQRGSQIF